MASDAVKEEFVTIVPVGESRQIVRDPTFVTVLTLGSVLGAAEVVVRRPRGARLGLGLKFEGGSAAAERVRRLLVQSCAEGSPAANATAPWGNLIPGDEILAIDGVSVSDLTRIDCVRRLKDSDENLKLLVRHFDTEELNEEGNDVIDSIIPIKQTETVRPNLPPPVPPRKLGKKNSFKDKSTLQSIEHNSCINNESYKQTVNEKDSKMTMQKVVISTNFNNKLSRKSSFDSHIHRKNKESIACLKKGSPEEVRRLVRRLSDGKTMPPEAEVYIDLLSNEWERCLALADAESDDTGSSISTVVDRLGSMTSSVENSIPSTPIMQQKTIDIQKVLNCIENIDSNLLKDITNNSFLEKSLNIRKEDNSTDKHVYSNGDSCNLHGTVDLQRYIQNDETCKKNIPNDKNNNITQNITLIQLDVEKNTETNGMPEIKMETYPEKPTPMPRSVKSDIVAVNSEVKVNSISEVPEVSASDNNLLTPTKKNCIESWLLRSQAEMNNKNNEENLNENNVPEALPRLIDFVPKPQFKESGSEATVIARPTTAPPPPPTPVEAREDGSGASLDTIGELDETADSTVTEKLQVGDKVKDRKSYDSSFWEDRVNKSDVEDKSLSNDESPLPTCPRQPPDGVETPSDAIEKVQETASSTRMPPRLSSGWSTTRTRLSYSRSQDARSEASVKDKIAMFSNDHAISTDRVDKCATLPSRNNSSSVTKISSSSYMDNYNDVLTLDRRLTKSQDNLDEVPSPYTRRPQRPEAVGALENTNTLNGGAFTLSNRNSKESNMRESKPLFYGSTNTLPSSLGSTYAQPIYHARSGSDDSNKSSHKLEYLIEQRKKSTSKLRALMIPETQAPIVDLPEIKVEHRLAPTFTSDKKTNIQNKAHKKCTKKPLDLKDNWKTHTLTNNIPKYSPAFKRKSLQLYTSVPFSKETTPEPKCNNVIDYTQTYGNKVIPLKPPRQSLDVKNTFVKQENTLPAKLFTNSNKSYKEYKTISDSRGYSNMEIKICTITDVVDSDNDSAMSSTQSSYRSSASSPLHNLDSIESDSSHLSPRIPHYAAYTVIKPDNSVKPTVLKTSENYAKINVCRSVSSDTNVSLSSSAGSAATSGSQASCSSLESSIADTDKKKIVKVYDIDTINRKNILASSKCRSGRDAKLNSPVVETKFSNNSYDKNTSQQQNAPDRLSSLTLTVSATSNKGETRRRNKVIAASDSDTDNELNIRQRKTEFKNTRLKRNSSSSSKNKQSDVCTDTSKGSEDAPQVISERIIKEINKTGFDDYKTTKNNKVIENSLKRDINESKVKPKRKDVEIIEKSTSDSIVNDKRNSMLENKKPRTENMLKNDSVPVNKQSTYIIRLKKGAATGVGLILAGGIDCEAKDVTVHRVLADSIAQEAGLKRGTRVRSINGCSMDGLTHAQSVAILKEQRSEVIIEIENEIPKTGQETQCGSANESKARLKADAVVAQETTAKKGNKAGELITVVLEKAGKAGGTGLGFSLDGGRDSQDGGRPLTIKKLFQGAVAEQSKRVFVGAELLSAGGKRMEGYTRFQAWDFLKSLPVGPVTLILRNPASADRKKD